MQLTSDDAGCKMEEKIRRWGHFFWATGETGQTPWRGHAPSGYKWLIKKTKQKKQQIVIFGWLYNIFYTYYFPLDFLIVHTGPIGQEESVLFFINTSSVIPYTYKRHPELYQAKISISRMEGRVHSEIRDRQTQHEMMTCKSLFKTNSRHNRGHVL